MSTIDPLLKFQALHMCYSGRRIDQKKKKTNRAQRASQGQALLCSCPFWGPHSAIPGDGRDPESKQGAQGVRSKETYVPSWETPQTDTHRKVKSGGALKADAPAPRSRKEPCGRTSLWCMSPKAT